MDRKDLAGLTRMTVVKDGDLWQVMTLVSGTHVGPAAQAALGLTPGPFRGLQWSEAVKLAREIEKKMVEQTPDSRARKRSR